MFNKLDVSQFGTGALKNHTHGDSAGKRKTAISLFSAFCTSIGTEPFMFQMSNNDNLTGKSGSRSFYWSKDLHVPPADIEISENDTICIVDVDEYMDIPNFLSFWFRPILLYTFQPSRAAKQSGEYSYHFNQDNTVNYYVSGGGFYTHHVWNYSSDSLRIVSWFWFIPYCVTVYHVDRKAVDQDHEIILLTPTRKIPLPFAIPAFFLIGGQTLERLQPVAENLLEC